MQCQACNMQHDSARIAFTTLCAVIFTDVNKISSGLMTRQPTYFSHCTWSQCENPFIAYLSEQIKRRIRGVALSAIYLGLIMLERVTYLAQWHNRSATLQCHNAWHSWNHCNSDWDWDRDQDFKITTLRHEMAIPPLLAWEIGYAASLEILNGPADSSNGQLNRWLWMIAIIS